HEIELLPRRVRQVAPRRVDAAAEARAGKRTAVAGDSVNAPGPKRPGLRPAIDLKGPGLRTAARPRLRRDRRAFFELLHRLENQFAQFVLRGSVDNRSEQ